jgi:hypothetical protein
MAKAKSAATGRVDRSRPVPKNLDEMGREAERLTKESLRLGGNEKAKIKAIRARLRFLNGVLTDWENNGLGSVADPLLRKKS